MIGEGLACVAIVVNDVEADAGVLARDIGLRRTDGSVGGPGQARV